MMSHSWDPTEYLAYADERGRPFVDLLARVHATEVDRVVDLGCGPGNLTGLLKSRWPAADVVGIDSSPEMVRRAREAGRGAGVRFEVADLRAWTPDRTVDVLFSNATLQWVPGHLGLLSQLVGHVAPGGWVAFQVPGNHEEPSHTLLRGLAADPRFAEHTRAASRPESHEPKVYLERLLELGCEVDAWETTYLHLLAGKNAVFSWVRGTGARPVLQSLPEALRIEFEREYRSLLREAYPSGPHGTLLRFRRVFVVARTAPGPRRPVVPGAATG